MTAEDARPANPKVEIAIRQRSDRPYIIADDTVIGSVLGPAQYVEIIALCFQNRFSNQQFARESEDESSTTIRSVGVEGELTIEENGAMRLTPSGALQLAAALAAHLTRAKMNTADEVLSEIQKAVNPGS